MSNCDLCLFTGFRPFRRCGILHFVRSFSWRVSPLPLVDARMYFVISGIAQLSPQTSPYLLVVVGVTVTVTDGRRLDTKSSQPTNHSI